MNKHYAKRLQEWVEQEAPKDKRGSLTKLHRRFVAAATQLRQQPITLSNISRWREGEVEETLSSRSLSQLAAVRGEALVQTRAWLEGSEFTTLPEQQQLSFADRARVVPADRLPDLLQEVSAIAGDVSLAISIASQRLKEQSGVKNQFWQLLQYWLTAPKPHWKPYTPIPTDQLLQEQTQPWGTDKLADIINREYGLSEYSGADIKKLEHGHVDRALIRLIASLKIVLDQSDTPFSDAELIDLAEGRASLPDFQCLDSQG